MSATELLIEFLLEMVSAIIDPLTDKKTPVLVKLLLGAVLILPVALIICYIVFECN